MMIDKQQIVQAFGGRLRVRVCGICLKEGKLLMVRHTSVGAGKEFWAPPGGGLEYGESVEMAVIREFAEETGLEVKVGRFLFVHEFLRKPLHGIELFFEVQQMGGSLKTGIDPEMEKGQQIIQEVKFLPFPLILALPSPNRHNLFTYCQSAEDLLGMNGFYSFKKDVK